MHHDDQTKPSRNSSLHEVRAPATLLPGVLARLSLPSSATDQPDPAMQEQVAMTSPSWYIRAAAVRSLEKHDNQATLDLLLTALEDEHESVRTVAVHALGKTGSRIPIERLLHALQDPSWQVREMAALALAKFGTHALPALLQAQHDPSSPVRDAAQIALQSTEQAAQPALSQQDSPRFLPAPTQPQKIGEARQSDGTPASATPIVAQATTFIPFPAHPTSEQQTRRKTLWNRLSLLAAALVVTLLVSSLLLTLYAARSKLSIGGQPSTAGAVRQAGIYFLNQSTLWKVDNKTDRVVWSLTNTLFNSPYLAAPLVTDGRVFIDRPSVSNHWLIYAMDARTGHVLWHYDAFPSVAAKDNEPAVQLGTNDILQIADGKISFLGEIADSTGAVVQTDFYVLDEQSGQILQTVPLQSCSIGNIGSLPRASQGLVYGVSALKTPPYRQFICAFSTADGSLRYSTPPEPVLFAGLQIDNSMIYASQLARKVQGKVRGYISAWNAQTGKLVWQSPDLNVREPAAPLFIRSHTMYVQGTDVVYALNTATGQIIWQKHLPPSSFVQEVTGGVMYVATSADRVTSSAGIEALSTQNSSLLWQHPFSAGESTVFLGRFTLYQGTIYASVFTGQNQAQASFVFLNAASGSPLGQVTLPWLHANPVATGGLAFTTAP
jgi:outer membrane protein assembly factor BamB